VPGLVASILNAVAVRAAAASLADIGIWHAHLDHMMSCAFMAALLVAAAAKRGGPILQPAIRKVSCADGAHWFAMLIAGTLGRAAGDRSYGPSCHNWRSNLHLASLSVRVKLSRSVAGCHVNRMA
jgi:hypothetical protein